MSNDYVIWELISFTRILEALLDKIKSLTFLEPQYHKIVIDFIKIELIIKNNKIKDRRKRNARKGK